MKRYPDGWQGKHFFQKQSPSHMPEWIAAGALPGLDARGRDEDHRLRARRRRARAPLDGEHGLHRPARLVVSRRPSGPPGLGHVRPRPVRGRGLRRGRRGGAARQGDARAARARELPEDVAARAGSTSSCRSRAGTPTRRRASSRRSSRVRSSARTPALVTTEWAKEKRRGVLVDANQNGPGKTNASVYSVRPRAGAPVSTPLRWEEVVPGLDPARSRWTPCSTGSRATETSSRACSAGASRSPGRSERFADGDPGVGDRERRGVGGGGGGGRPAPRRAGLHGRDGRARRGDGGRPPGRQGRGWDDDRDPSRRASRRRERLGGPRRRHGHRPRAQPGRRCLGARRDRDRRELGNARRDRVREASRPTGRRVARRTRGRGRRARREPGARRSSSRYDTSRSRLSRYAPLGLVPGERERRAIRVGGLVVRRSSRRSRSARAAWRRW